MRMHNPFLSPRFFAGAAVAALSAALPAAAARPHDPFVEKVITQDRSRQLKVALDAKLWVLYDLPQCQLYQAWAGGTKGGSLQLAAFTWFDQNPHFPDWFVSEGPQYFKEDVGEYFASWTKLADIDTYYKKWAARPRDYQAWTVLKGTAAVDAKVRYRGYAVQGDLFRLEFSLALPDGGSISVTETPEYGSAGGKINLVRKLALAGIPAGCAVRLKLPAGGNWTAAGKGAIAAGLLSQSADGETTLTGAW
jgi:hypothetical protein